MWMILILGQIVYANQLDTAGRKAAEAFFIQSGVKANVERQLNDYKNLYVNKSVEKKMVIIYSVSDIIVNKRVGITYEF